MSKPGISKALERELKVATIPSQTYFCPNQWCSEKFGGKRALREHYETAHKCGRCNDGRHHKCKEETACGCLHESHKERSINTQLIVAAMQGRGNVQLVCALPKREK
jgi:hypothetical protein